MAEEVLRLKVDKGVYQQTLDSLEAQLTQLKTYRDDLNKEIERLKTGNTFSGSDVKAAIEKAEQTLEAVEGGIKRVTGYHDSIKQQLEGVQVAAATLASNINGIDVPNMFN